MDLNIRLSLLVLFSSAKADRNSQKNSKHCQKNGYLSEIRHLKVKVDLFVRIDHNIRYLPSCGVVEAL